MKFAILFGLVALMAVLAVEAYPHPEVPGTDIAQVQGETQEEEVPMAAAGKKSSKKSAAGKFASNIPWAKITGNVLNTAAQGGLSLGLKVLNNKVDQQMAQDTYANNQQYQQYPQYPQFPQYQQFQQYPQMSPFQQYPQFPQYQQFQQFQQYPQFPMNQQFPQYQQQPQYGENVQAQMTPEMAATKKPWVLPPKAPELDADGMPIRNPPQ